MAQNVTDLTPADVLLTIAIFGEIVFGSVAVFAVG